MLAVALLFQITALPSPTGHYKVGTESKWLLDATRQNPVTHKKDREVAVQYWYPTDARTGTLARYIPESELLPALIKSGYYLQTESDLKKWGNIRTHALSKATIAPGHFPILIFEPGLGTSRVNYTSYCEELASNGYFVAAIDPAFGTVAVSKDRAVHDSGEDKENGDPNLLDKKAHEWACDMSFALTELARSIYSRSLDLDRVGAFGHSSGGAAATTVLLEDPRFRCAVNLDGLTDNRAIQGGSPAPILRLGSNPNYSDADLARLGRTRTEWEERASKGRIDPAKLPEAKSQRILYLAIKDTGHLSFSDAPFMMPSTITHFSSHPLDPMRTWRLATGLMRAFFDHELKGKSDQLSSIVNSNRDVIETTVIR